MTKYSLNMRAATSNNCAPLAGQVCGNLNVIILETDPALS